MTKLTDQQIKTLLLIRYNIRTDEKSVTLDKDVLYSLMNKCFEIGFELGVKKGNE